MFRIQPFFFCLFVCISRKYLGVNLVSCFTYQLSAGGDVTVYQQGASASAIAPQRPEGVAAEAVSYQGAGAVFGTGPVTTPAPGLIGAYEGGSVTTGEIQKGKFCTLMRSRVEWLD